jgi:hypothetical protein
MKRSNALILIAILVVATVALIYFSIPDIHYYSYSVWTTYQKNGDHWYTLNLKDNSTMNGTFTTISCKNCGLFVSSFSVIITLKNAYFLYTKDGSNQETNDTVTVMHYILHPLEEKITEIPFVINSTHFIISVLIQSNQPFIKYSEDNWAGQSVFPYSGDNNTWGPGAIS